MKKNAFATLIKDIILALVAYGLAASILSSGCNMDGAAAASCAMAFAGVPFGWRWASSFITAVSLKGIGIKLIIAVFLGIFAIFIVIGGDILRCIGQIIGKCTEKKRSRRYRDIERDGQIHRALRPTAAAMHISRSLICLTR